MRYLGIDYGTKRTGLAVSDEAGRLAFPYKVLANRRLIEQIIKVVQQERIERIILGQSFDYQGRANPVMKAINDFKEKLEKVTGLEVIFESEVLTTKQARRIIGRTDQTDAAAAALILQSYLDRQNAHAL